MLAVSVALPAAFVLAALGTAAPASAWGPEGTTGDPGQVVLPQVQVSDVGTSTQDQTLTFHGNAGPRVFHSPATPDADATNVAAVYALERWNGAQWVNVVHQTYEGRILPSAGETSLPMVWLQPPSNEGSYRVSFTFTWSSSSNPDRVLAEQHWVSKTADDLSCGGTLRACAADSGHVTVGPLTN
ncbi:hypothetical protein ABZT27_13010 [Streptomyces sp. NPDC005389]|uniref:hypothetical protein n=1 Tax=unclassified Streptomyces TaxID=2593676 RepID=UPI0033B569AF